MTKPTIEQQRDTIATMLNDPANIGFIRGTLAPGYFADSNLSKIAETILAIDERGETVTTYALKRDTDDAACTEIIDELAAPPLAKSDDSSKPARFTEPQQPYPTDAFPAVWRDYIRDKARSMFASEAAIGTMMLPSLAGTIGNSREVLIRPGWAEACVLWAMLIQKTGMMKSPVIDAAVCGIEHLEAPLDRRFRDELAEYERQTAEWKSRRGKDKGEQPTAPVCERVATTDATIEAMSRLMSENPRGVVSIQDEMAAWFDGLDRYSSGNTSANWLVCHGGRKLRVDRAGKPPTIIPRAAVSLLGGIQPGVMRDLWTNRTVASGMAARFLLCTPPTTVKRNRTPEADPEIHARMMQVYSDLYAIPFVTDEYGDRQTGQLSLTADALDSFMLWTDGLNGTDGHNAEVLQLPERVRAHWPKLEGAVARIAMTFTLVDDPEATRVETEAIGRAITVVEWHKRETKRVYDLLGGAEHSPLLDHIRTLGGDTAARDLLRAGPFVGKPKAELLAELARLEDAGAGRRYYAEGRTERFRLTD